MECLRACRIGNGEDVERCLQTRQNHSRLDLTGDECLNPEEEDLNLEDLNAAKAEKEETSCFKDVEGAASIELFDLSRSFGDDVFREKVNLSIGAYMTEEGKPWVFPVVRKVEEMLANDETLNKEYLPVLGLPAFSSAAAALLLGKNSPLLGSGSGSGKAVGIQTLSGTGALRLTAEFLVQKLHFTIVYAPNETWVNHRILFTRAGFKEYRQYRYWDSESSTVDFKGFLVDLKAAPENSVVILHACAHNPTGADPTQEQWIQIAQVMKERRLFPVFDSAYQGFVTGDPDTDAWVVRYFAGENFEFFSCQSYAENFGLYSERVGSMVIVSRDADALSRSVSQMEVLVRGMYFSPPSHGARIIAKILSDEELEKEWRGTLLIMANRTQLMRRELRDRLISTCAPGNWDHLTDQAGMFSFAGLTTRQVDYLRSHYHIYIPRSGRINVCGLNFKNLDYVANAIQDVVTNFK